MKCQAFLFATKQWTPFLSNHSDSEIGRDLFQPSMPSTKITFIIMLMCIYIYTILKCIERERERDYLYIYIYTYTYIQTAGLTKRPCVSQWIARNLDITKWPWVLLPEVVGWIGSLCSAGSNTKYQFSGDPWNLWFLIQWKQIPLISFNHQRRMQNFIQKNTARQNSGRKKQHRKVATCNICFFPSNPHKSLDFSQAAQSHRTRSAPPVAGRWSSGPQFHSRCIWYIRYTYNVSRYDIMIYIYIYT